MVVADKCYEDYAVWNADFVSMFDRSDIHDMNALERAFLVAIDFSTRCSASDYMKYYFALRELSADALPQKPLSEAATRQLEHNTEKFQNAQKKKNANGGAFLRSVSLHHFTPDGNGAAPSESSDN
jgi:hypothetical protein